MFDFDTIERPATGPQINFIQKLAAERDYTSSQLTDFLAGNPIGIETASTLISELKAAPRKTTEPETTSLPHGVYVADGKLFRVYPGRGSGRMLAKQIVGTNFIYVGLASRFVTLADRLSVEDAAKFGSQFGVCCVCEALLTDPESIALGIGPVCRAKYSR